MTEGSVTMENMDTPTYSQSSTLSQTSKHPTENTRCGKCTSCLKTIYSWISSLIGLLLLLSVYTVVGAFIFNAIEAPFEKQQKKNIILGRQDIMGALVNITREGLNETELSNKMFEQLTHYETMIYDAYKNGVTTISTEEPKWNIYSALFYCGTIYTTIGYGHISPSTDLGRVVTIIYAVFGIPLALIALADLGKKFTVGLKFVWAFVRHVYYCSCCNKARITHGHDVTDAEASGSKVENGTEVRPGVKVYFGYEVSTEFNIHIFVVAFIVLVYMFLGAWMYMLWEEWSYLEAVYFVFISISTIGFGDVTPAHPKYFLLSSVYVFIGLSLISMSINVAMIFFNQQIDKAKSNIERVGEKARERAAEKIHDVKGTLHKARDKIHDIGKKKSVEDNQQKHSPSEGRGQATSHSNNHSKLSNGKNAHI